MAAHSCPQSLLCARPLIDLCGRHEGCEEVYHVDGRIARVARAVAEARGPIEKGGCAYAALIRAALAAA